MSWCNQVAFDIVNVSWTISSSFLSACSTSSYNQATHCYLDMSLDNPTTKLLVFSLMIYSIKKISCKEFHDSKKEFPLTECIRDREKEGCCKQINLFPCKRSNSNQTRPQEASYKVSRQQWFLWDWTVIFGLKKTWEGTQVKLKSCNGLNICSKKFTVKKALWSQHDMYCNVFLTQPLWMINVIEN